MRNHDKTYLLRDVPAELWRAVKARAAQRDETIRAAILRLLKSYSRTKEN